MQNGGLSSILNPYSLLTGGANLTNNPQSSTTGPTSVNSLLKSSPYATQLNRSQISSLWSNGPASGLLGSIPRGPYGLGNSSQYMPRYGTMYNFHNSTDTLKF